MRWRINSSRTATAKVGRSKSAARLIFATVGEHIEGESTDVRVVGAGIDPVVEPFQGEGHVGTPVHLEEFMRIVHEDPADLGRRDPLDGHPHVFRLATLAEFGLGDKALLLLRSMVRHRFCRH